VEVGGGVSDDEPSIGRAQEFAAKDSRGERLVGGELP